MDVPFFLLDLWYEVPFSSLGSGCLGLIITVAALHASRLQIPKEILWGREEWEEQGSLSNVSLILHFGLPLTMCLWEGVWQALAPPCPSPSRTPPGILLPFVSLEVAVGGGCGFHPSG